MQPGEGGENGGGMGVVDGDGKRGASAHAEKRMRHLQHVQMYTQ